MARKFAQRPTTRQPLILAVPSPYTQLRIRQGGSTIVNWQAGPLTSTTLAPAADYLLDYRTGTTGAAAETHDLAVGVLALMLGSAHVRRRNVNVTIDNTQANLGAVAMAAAAGYTAGNEANFYSAATGTFSWDDAGAPAAWTACSGAGQRAFARIVQTTLGGTIPVGIINAASSDAGLVLEAAADPGTTPAPLVYWLSKGISGALYSTMLARVAAAAPGGASPELVEWCGGDADARIGSPPSVTRYQAAFRQLVVDLLADFPKASFLASDVPFATTAALIPVYRGLHLAQRRVVSAAARWFIAAAARGCTQRDTIFLSNPGYTLHAHRAGLQAGRILL